MFFCKIPNRGLQITGQITENLHLWSLLNGLNDNCDILLVSRFEFTGIMTTSFQLQSHLKLFPISIPLVHKDAQCWVPSPVSSSAKQVHRQESSNQ